MQQNDQKILDKLSQQIEEIISVISESSSFLVISHLRPDGDAIGSVIGFVRSLRKAGKVADILLRDQPSERFQYLFADEIIYSPETLIRQYDAVCILDTSTMAFTGVEEFLSSVNTLIINVDHHLSNELFGDLNFIDPSAGATCEIIWQLLKKAQLPCDKEVAEPLYLGLVTDTRFFQNDNLHSQTYRTAAEIVETGLNTATIHSKLSRTRTLTELQILGLGLRKIVLSEGGAVASVVLSKEEIASCGATFEHIWSCGLFGFMTSIAGVIAAVAIMESPEGKCFCEFRSNEGFNVKEIAVEYGGGGHLAASGCSINGPLDKTSTEVIEKLRSLYRSSVSEK